ncbi:MAG: oligosaccharide flippase family protein [Desulfosarcina sp.]|nr:oligosaccharide flippase family protein [Desulfobacterales bacterium]
MTLRNMAADKKNIGRILGNALACRLVCTSLAVAFVIAAAWVFDISPTLRMGLLVAGGGWIAFQASEFMVGIFQEKLRQDYAAITEAAAAAVTFMGVFILSRLGSNLYGMLGAAAFGFMFSFTLRVLLARRLVSFRLRFEYSAWWDLMKSGLPIAASYSLILIYVRGDVLLLAHFQSPTDVGLYDIGAKIYEISASFPYLFGGLILPLMTRDYRLDRDCYIARLGGALPADLLCVQRLKCFLPAL